MEKFGKGQSVTRVEDQRFLTGKGRYVDDIAPADALHAYFLRSNVSHGEILDCDIGAAREAPGVQLILTADDLRTQGVHMAMKAERVKNLDGSRGIHPERPLLAGPKVRFVGECIALIVADSLTAAKDAAEMIGLDIHMQPAHVATAIGGPQIHPEAPDNLAYDWGMGDKAAVNAALAKAAHVIRLHIPDNRVIVNSMEPRGVFAQIEDGRLHVTVNGQGVWGPKKDLARHLKMDAEDIRVTTPDVGGGFGMKGMCYPEMICVAHAARVLGKPVRWMSERTEAMLSDNAGRDLWSDAVMGFDANHRLIAYGIDSVANMGAYNSQYAQEIQTTLFSKVMPGTYDVRTVWLGCKGVFTNTTPVDAYRGAGRPEAIFALERMMDFAARKMGVDPWELRGINFIRPDQFPYVSATGVPYDVGDFNRVLTRADDLSDRAGFPARRAASERKGLLRGLGLCYYIESILGDKDEAATVVYAEDGTVQIHVGTQSNGQGHETVFAQFLADQTGIPADRIVVMQGDSDLIPTGGGTGGSRSVTVQNTATLAAVEKMTTAFTAFLADAEGADAAKISFDDERFRIPGSNLTPTMLDVAEMARAVGRTDLLRHTAKIELVERSFPNGAHVAEVEVDPETGVVKVVKYSVVDDFGNLINPMLAQGQVHGGIAQGLGQAITERTVYDSEGQLLTATFMDYAMPRADDMPMIAFASEPTPSVNNPMGMKGCGEAGTVGALAAVTNALQDALWPMGITQIDMPFTPQRVWALLQERSDAAA
ncbi:MAG: xanthine dehydrogenase family protein molybdopterin-binding subunit [Rhodobacterales bacterium]|nr:xanthine dehydrogenase family protein molybdopterin-binding subunit [Rhodobacterales bacterium]